MARSIVMLNLAETRRDPRVRRVASTLARAGAEVTVIGRTWEIGERAEDLDGFRIFRVDGPRRTERADMAALSRASPRAAALIEAVHAPLLHQDYPRPAGWAFRAQRKLKGLAPRLPDPRARQAALTLLGRADPLFAERALLHELRAMILTNVALFEAARVMRPSVVHANDLNTLLAGVMLHEALGVPLVYDAHEIFAEQYPEDERHPTWHHFYTDLERRLLPQTELRFTVSDAIARYFLERRGPRPFLTLRNVPSVTHLVPQRRLDEVHSRPRLTFQGAYVRYRGIDEIIRAVPHVPGAEFVLRGYGVHEPALRALIAELGLGAELTLADPVPMQALVGAAAECDVGLCPTVPTSLNMDYSLPNKVFEYCMAGLAVAVSDLVELRRLVETHQLGVVLPSLEPEAMGRALRELIADRDRLRETRHRAWRAARDHLNWEQESAVLLGPYRRLLG